MWSRDRAREAGLARRRLTEGPAFARTTRGRYLPSELGDDLESRCAAVLDVVPHAVLSHWTALGLHGIPVPRESLEELDVIVRRGSTEPRRAGLRCHVSRQAVPLVVVNGLPVTEPVPAWCDVAAVGATVAELVSAGDALWRTSLCAPDDIMTSLGCRPGRRGTARARLALELLDRRAESPMESVLRVVLVLAGLAPTGVNVDVRHSRAGAFLARVDLAYGKARLAVEYDGDHHRDRAQWQQDLLRRERLEADGWRVLVFTARDVLGNPEAVVRRVRAALTQPVLGDA